MLIEIGPALERLASLEHDQWAEWSQDLASKELLTDERLERWRRLWATPYGELTEAEKEQDRKWARLALAEARADFITKAEVEAWIENRVAPLLAERDTLFAQNERLRAWLERHQDHPLFFLGPDDGDSAVGLSGHGPEIVCEQDDDHFDPTALYALAQSSDTARRVEPPYLLEDFDGAPFPDEVQRAFAVHLASKDAQIARLTEALTEIRDKQGKVCSDFETCVHASCRSSYSSWHVADRALASQPDIAAGAPTE